MIEKHRTISLYKFYAMYLWLQKRVSKKRNLEQFTFNKKKMYIVQCRIADRIHANNTSPQRIVTGIISSFY